MSVNEQMVSVPRHSIEFARDCLVICQDQAFQSCECESCRECGLMPDQCTGTDCAKTCQCTTCEHCMNKDSIDSLSAILAQRQPAAHLTIPGALEWDGDNGTHGADGESRVHGEHKTASYQPNYQRMYHMAVMSLIAVGEAAGVRGEDQLNGSLEIIVAIEKLKDRRKKAQALLECSQGDMRQADKIMARQRVELANTEQSRRSFFDLSQDLEKRLAERDALLRSKSGDLIQYAARLLGAPLRELNGLIDEGARMTRPRVEAAVDFADSHMKDVAVQIRHIADALSAIAKPAKQKTCIECESEYCHGVCVERGDEHYDRDQAQKGGCDE